MPLKRRTLAIILIAIIALALAAWLIGNQTADQTENHISNAENHMPKVRIVDFKWTSDWHHGAVFPQWARGFNITLQNMGNMDIEGISVDIKLLANNTTEIWSETELYDSREIGYTPFDGKLNASEIRELRGSFVSSLTDLEQARDWGEKTYLVRVMVNSTVSDELMLPWS